MLKGISAQELANKNLVQDAEQVKNNKKIPYADIDRNLLIDETNISNEALRLYQRDLDIKKFTKLAMSDPDDTSHNSIAAEKIFNTNDNNFENKIVEGIFDSKAFWKDLLA